MEYLQETVCLASGVTFNGQIQREVVIRIPIVADSIEVEQECKGAGMLVQTLSLLRKQIVRFGAVPKESVTVDLLGMLTETDLEMLREASDDLKKKALRQKRD